MYLNQVDVPNTSKHWPCTGTNRLKVTLVNYTTNGWRMLCTRTQVWKYETGFKTYCSSVDFRSVEPVRQRDDYKFLCALNFNIDGSDDANIHCFKDSHPCASGATLLENQIILLGDDRLLHVDPFHIIDLDVEDANKPMNLLDPDDDEDDIDIHIDI